MKAPLEIKPLLGETWSRGPNYRVKPGQTIDIYPHFIAIARHRHEEVSVVHVHEAPEHARRLGVSPAHVRREHRGALRRPLHARRAEPLTPRIAFGGNEWKVDETMDAGAEDGSIREAIVVGVENTAARIDELTPTPTPSTAAARPTQYLAMITDEIKPMIDKDLRTIPRARADGHHGVVARRPRQRVRRRAPCGRVRSRRRDEPVDVVGRHDDPRRGRDHAHAPAKPLRVYVDSGDSGTSNDDVTNTTELAARYRTRRLHGRAGLSSTSCSPAGSTTRSSGPSAFPPRSTSSSARAPTDQRGAEPEDGGFAAVLRARSMQPRGGGLQRARRRRGRVARASS